jgi:exopolyphosphatase/guanosine-5'-triphosphate,3'-diphosphate pyrophosphatase
MTDYDYRLVNNHILTREEIGRLFAMLLPLSPAERLMVPGLERGREDLIIAGTLITLRTMDTFGYDRMTVSDFGLLEGVLLGFDVFLP